MAFEKCTVRQYMDAMYRGDTSVFNPDELSEINTEYIDVAELYDLDELNKVSYIHFIDNRINSIKLSIKLQRDFIEEFGLPYLPSLPFFKPFGHIVTWNNDKEKFLEKLERIESSERKYKSILANSIKELKDGKKSKGIKEDTEPKIERQAFIRTLNSLGKIGYKIDYDKTTMEEVALMIKQQKEEVEEIQNRK